METLSKSLEGLNPEAKVFVPLSDSRPHEKNYVNFKRKDKNTENISNLPALIPIGNNNLPNDLFKEFKYRLIYSETPSEKTNRHLIHKEGLMYQKPIMPYNKNGRYTWGIKINLSEAQIKYYIDSVNYINTLPFSYMILSECKNEYKTVLNNIEKGFTYSEIPQNAILYSFYIQKNEGHFLMWDSGLCLDKKSLFILGIYEIVG
jgi:hypothetical protein